MTSRRSRRKALIAGVLAAAIGMVLFTGPLEAPRPSKWDWVFALMVTEPHP